MSITIRCEELSARELEAIRAAASELVGAVKAHNDWISVQGNPMPTALGMHEKLNKLARAFDGCNTAIIPDPSDLPESRVMRSPPTGWTPIFCQLIEAFGNVWRECYGAPFTATRCHIDPPAGKWSIPSTIQAGAMLDSVLARWPSTPPLAQGAVSLDDVCAVFTVRAVKTVQNLAATTPLPPVAGMKQRKPLYAYSALRVWFVGQWPESADYLPEKFEDFSRKLSVHSGT